MFAPRSSQIPAKPRQGLVGLIVLLALVACGDDDSGRQFAGDEQATGPAEETAVQVLATRPSGSPAPGPSPIGEEQMFSTHGSQSATAIVIGDAVFRFVAGSDEITPL